MQLAGVPALRLPNCYSDREIKAVASHHYTPETVAFMHSIVQNAADRPVNDVLNGLAIVAANLMSSVKELPEGARIQMAKDFGAFTSDLTAAIMSVAAGGGDNGMNLSFDVHDRSKMT
jgi:hypothetical protein